MSHRTPDTAADLIELYVSAQVANDKFFEQTSSEAFFVRRQYRGTATFSPLQAQHSFLCAPLHNDAAFRARQRAILARVRSKFMKRQRQCKHVFRRYVDGGPKTYALALEKKRPKRA